MISVPGASAVFHEGIVAYSNAAKENRLGVFKETLKEHGAVSRETAYEMALGLLDHADYAVATTGIAGPASDDTEKLGISLRTYQRIEYGQQKPNVYVVVRLQRLFQKDISEIMEEYTE